MSLLGADCGPVRPPLRPLPPAQIEDLRVRLEHEQLNTYLSRLSDA